MDTPVAQSVFKISLQTDEFIKGLQEVNAGINALQLRLSETLAIKIDTKQFNELLGAVRNISKTMKSEMGTLGESMSGSMRQAGTAAGDALTDGVATAIESNTKEVIAAATESATVAAQAASDATKETIQSNTERIAEASKDSGDQAATEWAAAYSKKLEAVRKQLAEQWAHLPKDMQDKLESYANEMGPEAFAKFNWTKRLVQYDHKQRPYFGESELGNFKRALTYTKQLQDATQASTQSAQAAFTVIQQAVTANAKTIIDAMGDGGEEAAAKWSIRFADKFEQVRRQLAIAWEKIPQDMQRQIESYAKQMGVDDFFRSNWAKRLVKLDEKQRPFISPTELDNYKRALAFAQDIQSANDLAAEHEEELQNARVAQAIQGQHAIMKAARDAGIRRLQDSIAAFRKEFELNDQYLNQRIEGDKNVANEELKIRQRAFGDAQTFLKKLVELQDALGAQIIEGDKNVANEELKIRQRTFGDAQTFLKKLVELQDALGAQIIEGDKNVANEELKIRRRALNDAIAVFKEIIELDDAFQAQRVAGDRNTEAEIEKNRRRRSQVAAETFRPLNRRLDRLDRRAERDAERAEDAQLKAASPEGKAKAIREQNKALDEQFRTHKGLAVTVGETASRLARWLVMYKLIHQTILAVENGFKALVGAGIEYQKSIETQQLGLRGVLAENYKIKDANDQTIEGTAALTLLQKDSEKQWRQIQSASLAVVGTTEDMMTLYSGILPFASQLGRNLTDVQEMTKATAVAASLMGVSFQDARSAVIAMLQGRALTRNRLVGMLGIEPKDVKDASTRFQVIQSSLDAFLSLSDEAQRTLAASAETAREFAGIIGSAFAGPALDAFKRFVKYLTDTLFILQKNELIPTQQLQAFKQFISAGVKELIDPLLELGKELGDQAGTKLPTWAAGVLAALKPLIWFISLLAQAGVAATTLAAQSQGLIKTVSVFFGVLTASNAIVYVTGQLRKLGEQTGFVGWGMTQVMRVIPQFNTLSTGLTNTLVRFGKAQKDAAETANGLIVGIRTLASAAVFGALITGLTLAISKVWDLWDAAKRVQAIAKDIAAGNLDRAQIGNEKDLGSSEWSDNMRGIDTQMQIAAQAYNKLGAQGMSTFGQITTAQQQWQDSTIQLGKEIDKLQKKYAEFLRAKDAKGAKAVNWTPEDEQNLKEKKQRLFDITKERDDFESMKSDVKNATSYAPRIRKMIEARRREIEKELKNDSRLREFFENPGLQAINDEGGFDLARQAKADQFREDLKRVQSIPDMLDSISRYVSTVLDSVDTDFKKEAITDQTDKQVNRPSWGSGEFTDKSNKALEALKKEFELQKSVDEYMIARGDLTREKAAQNEANRQQALTEFIAEQYIKREESLVRFNKKADEYNSQDPKNPITQEERDGIREAIDAERQSGEADAAKASLESRTALIVRANAFAESMRQYELTIEAKEDELVGRIGEKAVDQWNKFIAEMEKSAREAPESMRAEMDAILARARSSRPRIERQTSLEQSDKAQTSELDRLSQEERRLGQMFENNAISANKYADELYKVQQQERNVLARNIATKEAKLLDTEDVDKAQQLRTEIDSLKLRMDSIADAAERMRQAFSSSIQFTNQLASFLGVFDGYGTKIKSIVSAIGSIGQSSGGFNQLLRSFSLMQANFSRMIIDIKALKSAGGGLGSMLGMLGGFKPKIGSDGGPDSGKLTNQASGLQTAMGALAVAGTAASIGIGIASALFQRAVERKVKAIRDSTKSIADAVDDGRVTIGDALANLQAERQRQVAQNSGSKAGRKALRETADDYEQQAREYQNRIKSIRENFDQQLASARTGSGPFGDFARMLLDLEKMTRDYLATFQQGTQEFAEAQKRIADLINITLAQAKDNLQAQLEGFEMEAIGAAQNVINLLQNRAQIMSSMGALGEQMGDLEKQRAELLHDKAKSEADLEKERLQRAQEILDVQKEIANVLKQAADDEAKVRQRGVLEGTSSIAQQKATDISKIRNTAQEQLTKLRKQLADLQDPQYFVDKQKEINDQFAKRTAELDKQERALGRQASALNDQLKMNEIQLDNARRVADVEGEIFDISGDQFELERKKGDLEVAAARRRVKQWKEVKELIEAIKKTAEGISFEPPAGFPRIYVQIGTITIDNSTTSSGTGDTGGAGAPAPTNNNTLLDRYSRQYGDVLV